jgi:hypothetical protein
VRNSFLSQMYLQNCDIMRQTISDRATKSRDFRRRSSSELRQPVAFPGLRSVPAPRPAGACRRRSPALRRRRHGGRSGVGGDEVNARQQVSVQAAKALRIGLSAGRVDTLRPHPIRQGVLEGQTVDIAEQSEERRHARCGACRGPSAPLPSVPHAPIRRSRRGCVLPPPWRRRIAPVPTSGDNGGRARPGSGRSANAAASERASAGSVTNVGTFLPNGRYATSVPPSI